MSSDRLRTLSPILCGLGGIERLLGVFRLETCLADEIPYVEEFLWHHAARAGGWAIRACSCLTAVFPDNDKWRIANSMCFRRRWGQSAGLGMRSSGLKCTFLSSGSAALGESELKITLAVYVCRPEYRYGCACVFIMEHLEAKLCLRRSKYNGNLFCCLQYLRLLKANEF